MKSILAGGQPSCDERGVPHPSGFKGAWPELLFLVRLAPASTIHPATPARPSTSETYGPRFLLEPLAPECEVARLPALRPDVREHDMGLNPHLPIAMPEHFRFSLNALKVKDRVSWSEINRGLDFFQDAF